MSPQLLQYLLSGLTAGSIYALVALGFSIIYNSSNVINFAQGKTLKKSTGASSCFLVVVFVWGKF